MDDTEKIEIIAQSVTLALAGLSMITSRVEQLENKIKRLEKRVKSPYRKKSCG